jgi:small subunit ribosomal protein S14
MARKSQLEANEKKAKLIVKFKDKREALLAVAKNKDATLSERFEAFCALSKLPKNSSKVRYRNRCVITGRARGFYRKFKLSRIMLRMLASFGRLPGVTKSSW